MRRFAFLNLRRLGQFRRPLLGVALFAGAGIRVGGGPGIAGNDAGIAGNDAGIAGNDVSAVNPKNFTLKGKAVDRLKVSGHGTYDVKRGVNGFDIKANTLVKCQLDGSEVSCRSRDTSVVYSSINLPLIGRFRQGSGDSVVSVSSGDSLRVASGGSVSVSTNGPVSVVRGAGTMVINGVTYKDGHRVDCPHACACATPSTSSTSDTDKEYGTEWKVTTENDPRLHRVDVAGAADVNVEADILGRDLGCSVSGSGSLRTRGGTFFQNVTCAVSGSGDAVFNGATIKNLSGTVAGSGDLSGFHVTDDANLVVAGSGDIVGSVSQNCRVNRSVAGSGDINLRTS